MLDNFCGDDSLVSTLTVKLPMGCASKGSLVIFFASLPEFVDYEIIEDFSFIPMFLSGIFLLLLVVCLPLNIAKNKGLLKTEKQLTTWYIYLFLAYPIALIHTIIVSKKND